MNCISTEAAQEIYKNPLTRFFMMKSFNNENVIASIRYNVWATTPKNEVILQNSFNKGVNVVLIFSVNGSSRFSGYATMKGRVGECSIPSNVFITADGSSFRGKTFSILWIRQVELNFLDVSHLRNSLNEYKPIKIGRDGQEIANDAGCSLCELIEQKFLNLCKVPQQNHAMSVKSDINNSFHFNENNNNENEECRRVKIGRRNDKTFSCAENNNLNVIHEKTLINSNNSYMQQEEENIVAQNSSLSSSFSSFSNFSLNEKQSTESYLSNPALKIFPIDLTNMSYEDYINTYQKSFENYAFQAALKPET